MRKTIPAEAFQQKRCVSNTVLRGVPLEDVWVVDLPGGGKGRTVLDVRATGAGDPVGNQGAVVTALFRLRFFLGRLFGWDRPNEQYQRESYIQRLDGTLLRDSLVAPGTFDGPFRVLYVTPTESLYEIRNGTVHAFLCSVLEEQESGYRFYWAIFVKRVSWFTPWYMALIRPFRHWIVYPALLERVERAWRERYAKTPAMR